MERFYYTATFLSYIALVLSVVTGTVFFRRIPRNTIPVFYYLLLVLLLETLAEILAHFSIENLFLFPLYSAVELFLLGSLFVRLLRLPKVFSAVLAILSAGIIFESYLGSLENSSTLIKPAVHVLIVAGAGYYLVRVLSNLSYDRHFLRVNYMLILYFSVSLLLFFFLSQLGDILLSEAYLLWGFHNLFLSLFYSILLLYFLRLSNSK